jgi:hypothetical protein
MSGCGAQRLPVLVADHRQAGEIPGDCGQATGPGTIEIVIRGGQVRDPDHRCAAVRNCASNDLGAEVTAEDEVSIRARTS